MGGFAVLETRNCASATPRATTAPISNRMGRRRSQAGACWNEEDFFFTGLRRAPAAEGRGRTPRAFLLSPRWREPSRKSTPTTRASTATVIRICMGALTVSDGAYRRSGRGVPSPPGMERYPPTCRHQRYEEHREAHRTRSSDPGRGRPDPAGDRGPGPRGPAEDHPDQRRVGRRGRRRPEDMDFTISWTGSKGGAGADGALRDRGPRLGAGTRRRCGLHRYVGHRLAHEQRLPVRHRERPDPRRHDRPRARRPSRSNSRQPGGRDDRATPRASARSTTTRAHPSLVVTDVSGAEASGTLTFTVLLTNANGRNRERRLRDRRRHRDRGLRLHGDVGHAHVHARTDLEARFP